MASEHTGELNTETGVPNEGHAEKVFPPFDPSTFAPQLVWLAITFGFLYVMMSRVALPRIANVLEERHDRIADDLDKAEELKTQSEEAIAAYEKALASARSRAHAIAAETHADVMAEIEAQRADTGHQLKERLQEADKRIDAMKTAALAHVREVATDAAGVIVERLLGSAPDATSVSGAIDQALGRNRAAE
jgi:F-type H+-transporting ATPase subunit b